MPRELTSEHGALIAGGHCGETTVLTLTLMTGTPRAFTADASTDALTSAGHGLANDSAVILRTSPGYFLPKPLQPETIYFVRDATADALKLAETQGGAAVDITWGGSGALTMHPATVIRLGTAEVEAGGHLYGAHLHPTDGLKLSKTASTDHFAARIQNADKTLGLAITDIEDELDRALAVVGTVHEDLASGAAHYDPRMTGYVVGPKVDEASSSVSFLVVSDVDEAEYAGELLTTFFPASVEPAAENHGVVNDLPVIIPRDSGDTERGPWRLPRMLDPGLGFGGEP